MGEGEDYAENNTIRTIELKVVGVTFKNEDGKPRQELLGTLYDDFYTEGRKANEIRAELRQEPDNPVDPLAVGVWVTKPEVAAGRIGFLAGTQTAIMDKLFRRGVILPGQKLTMSCGSNGKVAAKVLVRVIIPMPT